MARVFCRTFSVLTKALGRTHRLASMPSDLFSPPVNRSMVELDRSFFQKVIPVSACTIFDRQHIATVRKILQSTREVLQVSGVPAVRDSDSDPTAKIILLALQVKHDDSTTWSRALTDLEKSKIVSLRPYNLTLTYDNWTMSEILDAILPEIPDDEKETPAGFAQAGHVAHLNLTKQYLPYKYLIGQVLADKNPVVRTVINKTLDVGSDSVFRTFPYEVLCGPDDLQVTMSYGNCRFEFDYSKVYWNTRLNSEHERMCAKFKQGEAVCDVMAGVGPFALPAGKQKVFVRANDLNPDSYNALRSGIWNNKVADFVSASCFDGRVFIINETKNLPTSRRTFIRPIIWGNKKTKVPPGGSNERPMKSEPSRLQEPASFDHYVMNLPASAVEFLDAFKGVYAGRENEFVPYTDRKLPMIHVYTFQIRHDSIAQEQEEVCQKVSQYLGAEIKPDDAELEVEIYDVRVVAPRKKMYCASFRLPAAIAFAK